MGTYDLGQCVPPLSIHVYKECWVCPVCDTVHVRESECFVCNQKKNRNLMPLSFFYCPTGFLKFAQVNDSKQPFFFFKHEQK